MNRIEIERALNTDRVWLLEQISALASEDLTRPLTPSEDDPAMVWSAQDHLIHLSGIENDFNEIFRRHFAGEAVPIRLAAKPDGTGRSRDEMLSGLRTRSEPWTAGCISGWGQRRGIMADILRQEMPHETEARRAEASPTGSSRSAD